MFNFDPNKKYICPICNKECKSAGALGGHKAMAHGKNNIKEKFICPICNQELYTNKGAFNNHVKNHDSEYYEKKAKSISKGKKEFYADEERCKYAKEVTSQKMKENNPMFNKEIIDKMVMSRQEYFKNMPEDAYNKMVMNFINAPKKGNAVKHRGKYTPTKIEQMVIDFNIPGLIYNGNKQKSKTIRFANKTHKSSLTPDFIYEGTNKLIETFGIYWHPQEDEEKYIKACKENGYDVLIIWEDKLYENIELEKQRILEFLKEVK